VPPKARLSQEDFLRAAFALANEHGLDGLTLRLLGEAVGADTTAVYRYFRSKDALLVAMLDRLLTDVLTAEVDTLSPREELEFLGLELRKVLLANPQLAAALAAIEVPPANSLRLTDRIVRSLERWGLEGEDIVVYYQVMENFILGSSVLDAGAAPYNHEVRRARYLQINSTAFRTAGRSAEKVEELTERSFLAGVKMLGDAVEATIRAAGKQPS